MTRSRRRLARAGRSWETARHPYHIQVHLRVDGRAGPRPTHCLTRFTAVLCRRPIDGTARPAGPRDTRRGLQRLHDAGAALTASGGGPVAAPAHPHRSSPRHVRAPLASASVRSAQIEKACTHHQRVSTPTGTSRHHYRGPGRLRAATQVSSLAAAATGGERCGAQR